MTIEKLKEKLLDQIKTNDEIMKQYKSNLRNNSLSEEAKDYAAMVFHDTEYEQMIYRDIIDMIDK